MKKLSKLLTSNNDGAKKRIKKEREAQYWHAEGAYWTARTRDWFSDKYGLDLDPIQTDERRVPPPDLVPLIQKKSKATPEAFIASGHRHVMPYLEELDDHGFDPRSFKRILEFGMGLGRLIRHYYPFPAELYGCDVTEAAVAFSQRCYGDRVKVNQNQLAPPLPYETGFFDYVYANSVFTHIQTDVHEAWIAEMARIVRPGGGVIVTVFNRDLALPHVEEREYDRMRHTTGYLEWGSSHVRENCFYATPAKLEEWWSKHFTVLELRHHFKLQDHLVLRKP